MLERKDLSTRTFLLKWPTVPSEFTTASIFVNVLYLEVEKCLTWAI